MNERQGNMLAMYRGVVQQLDRLKLEAPPPLLAQMRTRLQRSIDRIEAHQHEQRAGGMAMTGKAITHLKAQVRRRQMLPLARIARPLLKFSPAESAIWKIPHARADARTVGVHAIAMAKALKPHRKLLASAGYSQDFLAAFERDAKQLLKGDTHAITGRAQRSRATRDIALQLKECRDTLQVITGLLMLHAPQKFETEWGAFTRMGKKIGRPRKSRRRKTSAPAQLPA